MKFAAPKLEIGFGTRRSIAQSYKKIEAGAKEQPRYQPIVVHTFPQKVRCILQGKATNPETDWKNGSSRNPVQ